jgi:PBP1b-binding outer membrane lipoprotein LpoB
MMSQRHVVAIGLVVLMGIGALGCAPRATRGGEGTAHPEMDAPALSVTLDREDINYLVADYLERLEPSKYWQEVESANMPPLVAIWPIMNATSQHIDDQMLTLLSSIETALINTGDVRVVARASQEALAREIGIQHGSAFDPSTARSFGKQLGVQYFFTGKITSVDEKLSKVRRVQYSLFLQVIEVETGLIRFQNEVTRSKSMKR